MMTRTGQLLTQDYITIFKFITFDSVSATFKWNAASAALAPRLIMNCLELIGNCYIVNVNFDVRIQSEFCFMSNLAKSF